jgi:hypothetical protein
MPRPATTGPRPATADDNVVLGHVALVQDAAGRVNALLGHVAPAPSLLADVNVSLGHVDPFVADFHAAA